MSNTSLEFLKNLINQVCIPNHSLYLLQKTNEIEYFCFVLEIKYKLKLLKAHELVERINIGFRIHLKLPTLTYSFSLFQSKSKYYILLPCRLSPNNVANLARFLFDIFITISKKLSLLYLLMVIC